MTRKLTLEIPDDLNQRLEAKAKSTNIPVETMVLNSLEQMVSQSDDPIATLIGTLSSTNKDISSHHDQYIGEAVAQEFQRDK